MDPKRSPSRPRMGPWSASSQQVRTRSMVQLHCSRPANPALPCRHCWRLHSTPTLSSALWGLPPSVSPVCLPALFPRSGGSCTASLLSNHHLCGATSAQLVSSQSNARVPGSTDDGTRRTAQSFLNHALSALGASTNTPTAPSTAIQLLFYVAQQHEDDAGCG